MAKGITGIIRDFKELHPIAYERIRTDAIDELETKLIDIILGNEEFTYWQKQEISLCLECVIEQLKEQK